MDHTVEARLQAMVTRVGRELVGVKTPVMAQVLRERGINDALVQISKGPAGGILPCFGRSAGVTSR